MCGPSGAQKQLSNEQSAFFNELQASYATNFGEQQGILSSLNSALEPILQAGPNQPGFSAAENAALTGEAINSAAAANRNAQVVAGSSAGGNTGVTTGGEKQLQAEIAARTGEGLSANENAINLENTRLGRENFFGAESGLAGVASLENPTPIAGAVTSAGNSAFNEATTIQNMRNQEEADIGGAVSGLAGVALGGIGNLDTTGGSSFGEQVGNFLQGMG